MERKKQAMGHRQPWSNLPQELLSAIAKHLTNPIDVIRFRSVCKSWRSSFPPLSTLLPLKLPFIIAPDYTIKTDSPVCLVLHATTVYLLKPSQLTSSSSSSNAWLIKVEEFNTGKLHLCNPLSNYKNMSLPENSPKSLNLLDFRLLEIAKAYNLTFFQNKRQGYFPPSLFQGNITSRPPSLKFEKVVFLNPACTSTITSDCAVAVIFVGGRLGVLRLVRETWRLTNANARYKFDDIVNYKGKLCAVNRRGRAVQIDIDSLKETSIAAPIHGDGGRRKRLVESSGDLFLVVRNHHKDNGPIVMGKTRNDPSSSRLIDVWQKTVQFKVYKMNEAQHKWVEVESLGHRVLLVGNDCSFAVSAQDFAGCKGNCIFFTTECFNSYGEGEDDGDESLEEIDDLEIGVYHLDNGGSFGPLASYPGYSEIFLPLPTWFHSNPISSKC